MTTPRRTGPHDDDDNYDDVGYFDLDRLARYSGLSISTLRRALRHPSHPLPHHRWPPERGRVLVRKRTFDAWMGQGTVGGTRLPRDHEPRDPSDPSWLRRAFRK